jgi:hypothetical protein
MAIEDILKRVNKNTTGIFERSSELIVTVPQEISRIIGDDEIHLSEFIVAKVRGFIRDKVGHPEITDEIFLKIPQNLSNPKEILQDIRASKKYLFINVNPLHEIVVEIFRRESGKTEINTIHIINTQELKRLEHKFPVVYSSGGTP